MIRTPEQITANQALSEAVENSIRAYDMFPANAVILDFLVTVEATTVDGLGDYDEEHYALCFPQGSMRSTVALGLITKAREILTAPRD